jgi:cytochrome c553
VKQLVFGLACVFCAALVPIMIPAAVQAAGDANAGAKIVQDHGCEGCHGASLKGGAVGPSLYGIEHRRTAEQIVNAIKNPRPPMPSYGFTSAQIEDLVAYLSDLDGGASGMKPTVSFAPNPPGATSTITVHFADTPPKDVIVTPMMDMGGSVMSSAAVHLHASAADPHTFVGKVEFSMGGAWTVQVKYDGKNLDVPVTVKD